VAVLTGAGTSPLPGAGIVRSPDDDGAFVEPVTGGTASPDDEVSGDGAFVEPVTGGTASPDDDVGGDGAFVEPVTGGTASPGGDVSGDGAFAPVIGGVATVGEDAGLRAASAAAVAALMPPGGRATIPAERLDDPALLVGGAAKPLEDPGGAPDGDGGDDDGDGDGDGGGDDDDVGAGRPAAATAISPVTSSSISMGSDDAGGVVAAAARARICSSETWAVGASKGSFSWLAAATRSRSSRAELGAEVSSPTSLLSSGPGESDTARL
jgi:hypothetical protein